MYIYIILFVSFLFSNQTQAQEWKLRKQKSGIEIYTRSVEGSSFDEFKGITTLANTSVEEVLDVILDVDNYIHLFPDCINAKILEQKGKYYDIHYISLKAPWPVQNRDAVYESTTTISENNKYARVDLKPLGQYLEQKKGFVRMYKGSGFWELKEISANIIQITYQFHGDPAGKIPAWLANSSVVSNPFHTFINLNNRLSK